MLYACKVSQEMIAMYVTAMYICFKAQLLDGCHLDPLMYEEVMIYRIILRVI